MNITKSIIEKLNVENKYKNLLKAASDESFNIFKICGVNHYENSHSSIIAELLNNNGSHNFKNKFLEEFILVLKNKKLFDYGFDFSFKNVNVHTEYPTKDGRIDILIRNDYQCIIIENKIYASDQFEQLKRYDLFGRENYVNQYQLIYLTLWGNEADDQSGGGVNYKKISYQETIIEWLERCVEVSARSPIIRETIIQYINHIKYLTNNNNNAKMNEELIEYLGKAENIESAFSIAENLTNVKNNIINKVLIKQLDIVCEQLGLINESIEDDRVNTSWSGFQIKNPKWKTYNIGLEFEAKDLRNLTIGICHIDTKIRNEESFEKLKTKFRRNNDNWVWNNFPKYNTWGSKAMIAIHNGEISEIFKTEIEKILEITKTIEM